MSTESAISAENHAYFRAIEDAFVRLRGAPFLLSPEDWRVAREWRRDGVPLEIVERVLETILAEREKAEAGKRRRIRSLRYFDSAVAAAWKRSREMVGTEGDREGEPLDVGARLTALAAALAGSKLDCADVVEELSALAGDAGATEEVERRLERLDAEMLARAREALDAARTEEFEGKVEKALARARERLAPEAVEASRERLERQVLRRLLELPLLSLFSPEATSGAGA